VRNRDDQLKGLFRQAVSSRLPKAIRDRKKKGFSAPVKQWFKPAALVKLVRQLQSERPDLMQTWFHPRLARHARRLKGSRAYKLWGFLTWLRKNG